MVYAYGRGLSLRTGAQTIHLSLREEVGWLAVLGLTAL